MINCQYRPWVPIPVWRGPAVARFLGLWVRIPPLSWMFVYCGCCMLSGRGLCVGLIIRPKEFCRL